MYGQNTQYPQGYNNQQPQQQQGDGNFWPSVSGFKCGPSKSGKGHTVMLTLNSGSRSKNPTMLFAEFMSAMQQAFEASGGYGVRLVIPFHQGQGPRGMFQSATISVFPNNPPPAQGSFQGGQGGGRRQYPPRQGFQQQGQGYPPQGFQGPTQGMAPTQPQVPPQQMYLPQQGVSQGTSQGGPVNPGLPPQGYPPGGNGQTAPTNAYPSNNEDDGQVLF